jgi:hypothetical protein
MFLTDINYNTTTKLLIEGLRTKTKKLFESNASLIHYYSRLEQKVCPYANHLLDATKVLVFFVFDEN